MDDVGRLKAELDVFATMGVLADAVEDAGRPLEAHCWRLLSLKRRFPSWGGKSWRWFFGQDRRSGDKLPRGLFEGGGPMRFRATRKTLLAAYEEAVRAMLTWCASPPDPSLEEPYQLDRLFDEIKA